MHSQWEEQMAHSDIPESANDSLSHWVWVVLLCCLLFTAATRTDLHGQSWIAGSILVCLLLMRNFTLTDVLRNLFLILAAYLTARYFFWRTLTTLNYYDFFSFCGAVLLYLAEVFCIVLYLLSIFINIYPYKRASSSLSLDPTKIPTVDILVPSYNESTDMLEVTLLGALQVRYPRDKLNIYLLDDGGTTEKRNDPDPQRAAAALLRHQTLRALCERIGARYLARDKNEHAKAGNLNAALPVTYGELILVLDADHVPTVDILERTVGLFEHDPRLFLVQTPHFFINPDPIEKHNVKIFGSMPTENDMFYSVMQHGLDFWNASFFCGSAAVLRRTHLQSGGGVSCSTITEDAQTSLHMHEQGFNSAYVDRPMISGMQPDTYVDFIVQRVRWAQGMAQLFVLTNPLLRKGLSFGQRLGYLSSSFFWFFGYARVVFLLAPAAYLLFGLRVYDANLHEVLSYALPHLIAAMLVADHLFGKVRWAFVSEVYEIMQSLFSLPAVFRVILNPHAPRFLVTPKGEQVSEVVFSKLSGPFYVVYVLALAALVAGVYRYFNYPAERDTVYITMAWELMNLILLNAAIGALIESKQRRANPRMPADMHGQLVFDVGSETQCHIIDLSHQGALLVADKSAAALAESLPRVKLRAFNAALQKVSTLGAKVCNVRELGDGTVAIGTEFEYETATEKAEAVALAYGDSERWVALRQARNQRQGILKSFVALVMLGTKYAVLHFMILLEITAGLIAKARQRIVRGGRSTVRRTAGSRRGPGLLSETSLRVYSRFADKPDASPDSPPPKLVVSEVKS